MAVILAGGEGERLSILSQERAKPAVPFGGKYRIIDFTLSNCVNSGIDDVVVLTQYNPRSLNDHIGLGRPWDLDRNTGGVKLLQPYIARGRVAEWYRGTADAVLRNMRVLENTPADTVLVLAGDHIYKMDYQPFVAAHRRHRADVTIAVRPVPLAEATRMGILAMDENDRVTEWQEKPKQPKSDLASMGVYVFTKKTLLRWLSDDLVDFGANVVPAMLDAGARVFGYRYNGYWQDVGTIQSFWEANMALLDDDPALDLYDKEWIIHTRSEERAPAKVGPTAQVHRSLISHGCVIAGTVVNSVLSPGVRVDVGAVVRESIVMFDSVIRSGAVVDRAILDKEVVIGPGAIVGDGPIDDRPNRNEPGRLNTGITVVGKHAIVPLLRPDRRNVRIAADVRTSDFSGRVVRSGESVDAGSRRAAGRARPAATGRRPPSRPRSNARSGRSAAVVGRASPRTDPAAAAPRAIVTAGRAPWSSISDRLPEPCHPPTGLASRGPRRCRRLVHRVGLAPSERAEREGIASWDLVLDGRRRFDLRITVILDPALAVICWAHYAPPIGDMFRKSYRKLLRWNDEFPFAKFSVGEDERPLLAVELPIASASADELGLAIARILGIADRLLEESKDWLWIGGRIPDPGDRTPANLEFLDRFAGRLAELTGLTEPLPASPEPAEA